MKKAPLFLSVFQKGNGIMAFSEMNIFELIMLIAFGSSWPFAVYKTIRTKKVEGKSGIFLVFIFIGYISGTVYKCTANPDAVLALYIFNGSMVFTEMILMIIYKNSLVKEKRNIVFMKATRAGTKSTHTAFSDGEQRQPARLLCTLLPCSRVSSNPVLYKIKLLSYCLQDSTTTIYHAP